MNFREYLLESPSYGVKYDFKRLAEVNPSDLKDTYVGVRREAMGMLPAKYMNDASKSFDMFEKAAQTKQEWVSFRPKFERVLHTWPTTDVQRACFAIALRLCGVITGDIPLELAYARLNTDFPEAWNESKTFPKPWPKKYKLAVDITAKCRDLNGETAAKYQIKDEERFNELCKEGDLVTVAYSNGSVPARLFLDKKTKTYWWTITPAVVELADERDEISG